MRQRYQEEMIMDRFHQFLINIFHLHEKKSQQGFKRLGLSKGQPKMIEMISGNNGCSQKLLAESCSIEPATVTSILANMVNKDLVYKVPELQENGIRIQRVYLTEKGICIADEVEKIVDDMEEISFSGFTLEERAECLGYLKRIFENLKNSGTVF